MTTNITQDHRRSFEALTSGEASNFCLFSCFVSGQRAPADPGIPSSKSPYRPNAGR